MDDKPKHTANDMRTLDSIDLRNLQKEDEALSKRTERLLDDIVKLRSDVRLHRAMFVDSAADRGRIEAKLTTLQKQVDQQKRQLTANSWCIFVLVCAVFGLAVWIGGMGQ